MRSGFLALFVCAQLTALGQSISSSTAAPAGLGTHQQIAPSWTACSKLSPKFSIDCVAPQISGFQPGSTVSRQWKAPQFDSSGILQPPLLSAAAQQHWLLALNQAPDIRQDLRKQWPNAKGELIPTQWPNAKIKPIPTQWPLLSLTLINTQPRAPQSQAAAAR